MQKILSHHHLLNFTFSNLIYSHLNLFLLTYLPRLFIFYVIISLYVPFLFSGPSFPFFGYDPLHTTQKKNYQQNESPPPRSVLLLLFLILQLQNRKAASQLTDDTISFWVIAVTQNKMPSLPPPKPPSQLLSSLLKFIVMIIYSSYIYTASIFSKEIILYFRENKI